LVLTSGRVAPEGVEFGDGSDGQVRESSSRWTELTIGAQVERHTAQRIYLAEAEAMESSVVAELPPCG